MGMQGTIVSLLILTKSKNMNMNVKKIVFGDEEFTTLEVVIKALEDQGRNVLQQLKEVNPQVYIHYDGTGVDDPNIIDLKTIMEEDLKPTQVDDKPKFYLGGGLYDLSAIIKEPQEVALDGLIEFPLSDSSEGLNESILGFVDTKPSIDQGWAENEQLQEIIKAYDSSSKIRIKNQSHKFLYGTVNSTLFSEYFRSKAFNVSETEVKFSDLLISISDSIELMSKQQVEILEEYKISNKRLLSSEGNVGQKKPVIGDASVCIYDEFKKFVLKIKTNIPDIESGCMIQVFFEKRARIGTDTKRKLTALLLKEGVRKSAHGGQRKINVDFECRPFALYKWQHLVNKTENNIKLGCIPGSRMTIDECCPSNFLSF